MNVEPPTEIRYHILRKGNQMPTGFECADCGAQAKAVAGIEHAPGCSEGDSESES